MVTNLGEVVLLINQIVKYEQRVESIDNLNAPSKDFQASRMSIGDKIYKDENGKIYVKCDGTTVIRMVEAD